MSATYTIIIQNKSADNQQYMLFNHPPQDETIGQAWSNVWVKTAGTPFPNGKQVFTIKEQNFAVCGTTDQPLADGVSVTESDWAQVTLDSGTPNGGTMPGLDIVNDAPAFTQPYGKTDLANSFAIKTASWSAPRYQNVYCGLGKYDAAGNVVPVAVWTAKPSQTYKITPVVTFYISTGSYQAGDAVDVTTLGDIATIDFTTAPSGATVATVTQNDDNTYSQPEFSYPKTGRELML